MDMEINFPQIGVKNNWIASPSAHLKGVKRRGKHEGDMMRDPEPRAKQTLCIDNILKG